MKVIEALIENEEIILWYKWNSFIYQKASLKYFKKSCEISFNLI
jgi:hypothetical protein